MSNLPGPQPEVKWCPNCKAALVNVLRERMVSHTTRKDGSIAPYTHTYFCPKCGKKFEINQAQHKVAPLPPLAI